MKRLAISLGVGLILVGALVGCEQGSGPNILVSVQSEAPLDSLEVWTKQYQEGGEVRILDRALLQLPPGRVGYLITDGGESPLRLQIALPAPGSYALHFVGVLEGTASLERPSYLTATSCYTVASELVDQEVRLGLITAAIDADGDTFPEDLTRYCEARQLLGLPCDTVCNGPAFLALIDCNPSRSPPPELGPGCAEELPADNQFHPFAPDQCADCLDTDCYGGDTRCTDQDGDGYPGDVDCNDDDPEVHPGAEELCGNGVDDNCAVDLEGCPGGDLPCDADGDSFLEQLVAGCGRDCDDSDPRVNPFAFEGCGADPLDPAACPGCTQPGGERVDDNCDGRVDEGCVPDDIDQDGVPAAQDCDDCNAAVGPGFLEFCGDGIDQDCSGEPGGGDRACPATDQDGDGFEAVPDGSDCDDLDPRTAPGAPDRCGDGVAQNCSLDLACASITDGDGDGFGLGQGDCDDGNAAINAWAVEQCDPEGVDEDCDGAINELSTAGVGCGFDPTTERWYEIDFSSEMDNCGACRHRCEVAPCLREGDECVGGECACYGGPSCGRTALSFCCPADEERPAGCRDLTSTLDCGECGRGCRSGESCQADAMRCGLGRCVCEAEGGPCPEGPCWACCGEAGCVNLCTSPEHCGECGLDCTAEDRLEGDLCWGESPEAAACYCEAVGVRCSEGTQCTTLVTPAESCGCADLRTDEANCGGCGVACGQNEVCTDGACRCGASEAACAAPETCCPGGGCVSLEEDVANCGTCGNVCAFGESCVDGQCRCGSGGACERATQDCCSGTCRNVLTDAAHCGDPGTGEGCSHSCRPGVDCVDGNCACGVEGDCGAGMTCCLDSYCANLDSDEANCGACGDDCGVGESCVSGSCGCGDCNDGNACTQDPCEGGRCHHYTNDVDGDEYCQSGCPDGISGESPNDCANGNGDCNDTNPNVHPGRNETCSTPYDDDCDGDTNDIGADGCTVYYRDVDDDNYGRSTETQCRCAPQGDYTATVGGDCDDNRAATHPGALEQCNDIDDDCEGGVTDDGANQCSGGSAFCCGSPHACRTCCTDGQCPGTYPDCLGYSCTCAAGYSSCGGTCNCATGSSELCCGGSCFAGECCVNADCTGADVSTCNTATHTCYCNGRVCGGTCYEGATCCNDTQCTTAGAPNCNLSTHTCYCNGEVCSGVCYQGGNCCDVSDCSGGQRCCSHQCRSGDCCTDGDCFGADFSCESNLCMCNWMGGPDPCPSGWECCMYDGCCDGFCDPDFCMWM